MCNRQLKESKLYGNILVTAPDGTQMFRCSQKRSDWYVSRNLAIRVDNESDKILKLKFIPKGLGNHPDLELSEIQENRCCVCGMTKCLNRYHLIPPQYFTLYPEFLKSRKWYESVMMCESCGNRYDYYKYLRVKELEEKYSAPIDGIGLVRDTGLLHLKKIAYALVQTKNKLPENSKLELENKIFSKFGKMLSYDELITLSKSKVIYKNNFKSHGEIVMEQIKDIEEFSISWRKYFIEKMYPKYLPKHLKKYENKSC